MTQAGTPRRGRRSDVVEQPNRGRRRWLIGLLVVLVLIGAYLVNRSRGSTERSACEKSIVYLAQDEAAGADRFISQTQGRLTSISPSWYAVTADGSIQQRGTMEAEPAIDGFQREGLKVLPSVVNYDGRDWNGQLVHALIADPDRRRDHVQQLRDFATKLGVDGLDIDYEQLPAEDRDHFSAFLGDLADALHKDGRILSVALHAKTSEPGGYAAAQAQDYRAIGEVVDEVRVMAYDYHYSTSKPGPIAPLWWTREVTTWAATQIPKEKLIVGLSTYGYDWVDGKATYLTWAQATELARRHGATPATHPDHGEPSFTYTDDQGRRHEVWFADADSVHERKVVMREIGACGASYWKLGAEDPSMWNEP